MKYPKCNCFYVCEDCKEDFHKESIEEHKIKSDNCDCGFCNDCKNLQDRLS